MESIIDLTTSVPLERRERSLPRALLVAHDRAGNLVGQLRVTQWPVTIGRALHADLVLDDPHVAPLHLQIDQLVNHQVTGQVLATRNGVCLGKSHYGQAAVLVWPSGQEMWLGRTRVHLRMADALLADELPLARDGWNSWFGTATLLGSLFAWLLLSNWVGAVDAQRFSQSLPALLGGAVLALSLWCGVWALATKLFRHHPNFWAHVRIACATLLLHSLVTVTANMLAFMFSWDHLSRLDTTLAAPTLAWGLYRHLWLVAPRGRSWIAATCSALLALGLCAQFGTEYLQHKRLLHQRQMFTLLPPAWRVAAPQPVDQFLQDAKALKPRLTQALQDDADDFADAEEPGAAE